VTPKPQTDMRRHIQSASRKQIPLALSLVSGSECMSILRSAYDRLELSRRLSFEQVMSNRVFAIGVRNLADAIVHRRQQQSD
jgi:hypothetical protein